MLAGLSYETISFLWLGALVGGIAAGGTGFAFGLAASSIWLHYIDPLQSGILVAGCGLLLHLATIWQQRQQPGACLTSNRIRCNANRLGPSSHRPVPACGYMCHRTERRFRNGKW